MTKTKTFSLEETTIERLKLEDNQSATIEAALKLYWEHRDTAKLLISRNKEILDALRKTPTFGTDGVTPSLLSPLQLELSEYRKNFPGKVFEIRGGEVCMYNSFYKQWKPVKDIDDWE